MKKTDLKTGMIVENRSGDEYVVFINTCGTAHTNKEIERYPNQSFLVNSKQCNWISLDDYDEDMLMLPLCEFSDRFDIVKVYIPGHPYSFQDIENKYEKRILLWERNESVKIKEVTMKDIEDKFGCKIKIVNTEK